MAETGVVRADLTRRLRLLAIAIGQLFTSIAALVLAIFLVVGLALLILGWGIPIVLGVMALTRPLANLQRRMCATVLRRPVASPYLRRTQRGPIARLREMFRDPARRRDGYWLLWHGTAGLALSIVALVEGILDLLLWWIPAGLALRALCIPAAALLGVTEKSALALRVEQLAGSRAEAVDSQSAELRRIERDLHDGAQARLVALGMSLSRAEAQLKSDPEAARALLLEARTSSSAALSELRDLVRGISPPVLADRGLGGAVQALALAAPAQVDVRIDVPGTLPAPVETAAYFAIAEALTNAVKHGSAADPASGSASGSDSGSASGGDLCVEVTVVHRDGELHLDVRDSGPGGAAVVPGGGLDGIKRRLAAFDGTLQLHSPPGGPTVLHMVLPCVLSSPKTSPSSGTA
jgi:signal transduction histidine kinase